MATWQRIAVFAILLPASLAGQAPAPAPTRSHVIPALEIVGFDALLSAFDRLAFGREYRSDLRSIKRNLRTGWVLEHDPFEVNQLGHPYQGSIYHGFARASGLGFWTSLGYAFTGSALWEIAGETTAPSRNDQVASGIAGAFLGEALFRLGSLLHEKAPASPRAGRRWATTAVAPTLAFNRQAFGERFDKVFDSRGAAYYRRIHVGAMGTAQNRGDSAVHLRRNEGIVDISLEYGLPVDGYAYRRPFDYFSIRATASTANGVESVLLRGLLVGDSYGLGGRQRGVWGLYGNYDYIAPQLFRVSSTGITLATTGEWRVSDLIATQGTVAAGSGFAAVGSLTQGDSSDYHYGIAPQAMIAGRVIFGRRAALDASAREYYISRIAGTPGHDNILRAEASLTMRLHHETAVSVRYLVTRRDAYFPDAGSRQQLRGALGISLALLGHERFGSVIGMREGRDRP